MDMLTRLKNLDEPIRFAMIGAGSAGKGLLYQSSITPGMRCVALADEDVAKAVAAARGFQPAASHCGDDGTAPRRRQSRYSRRLPGR